MTNPLLERHDLPPFSKIEPEHVEPAITQILDENRSAIEKLLAANNDYTWDNLIQPLEDLDDRLNQAWSPVSHMNSVVNSDALRDAYNACLPKLSEYSTELGQNKALYEAYRRVRDSDAAQAFDPAQKRIIANTLRDFRLSGIALEADKQVRYKEIALELSKLSSKYEENVLDATQAWSKHIENSDELSGLPESALALAQQTAQSKDLTGWLFTLEFPSYIAVMTFADNPELRKEIYTAFSTRASDQGPHAGKWDNSECMEKILQLRHEKAQLLGFDNYAELSLETKMADSPEQVIKFLEDLAQRSKPFANGDLDQLREFIRTEHGVDSLEAWDLPYYSEKLRQHRFALSQEEVKAYFPADHVISGLFDVVKRLYGLKITQLEGIDTWHPEVKFFQISDAQNEVRGRFYLDLYARPKKRGGAWMDECISRKVTKEHTQTPVAYLTCNFSPPAGDDPALLTHDEVITLFHEFGHGLHHMLTRIDHLGVAGIHGVEWDAVELPSQFMENWCWEREAVALISRHYQSQETLPTELFDKMTNAKNFQSGMLMVRQIEFALFDFMIHNQFDPQVGGRIYATLQKVRQQVAVVIPPSFNRFPHGFSHIFAGGYAAGYYSYKWAEVLSADAFSLFEEHGVFDPATGQAFLQNILEKGGSQNAMQLFVAFRGREPEIDALLRHSGIAA